MWRKSAMGPGKTAPPTSFSVETNAEPKMAPVTWQRRAIETAPAVPTMELPLEVWSAGPLLVSATWQRRVMGQIKAAPLMYSSLPYAGPSPVLVTWQSPAMGYTQTVRLTYSGHQVMNVQMHLAAATRTTTALVAKQPAMTVCKVPLPHVCRLLVPQVSTVPLVGPVAQVHPASGRGCVMAQAS